MSAIEPMLLYLTLGERATGGMNNKMNSTDIILQGLIHCQEFCFVPENSERKDIPVFLFEIKMSNCLTSTKTSLFNAINKQVGTV